MRHPQFCALARAVELLGERWTLLIVRELLLGPRRFTDLRAGLDGVSSSVLAQRLAVMERRGLVRQTDLGPPVAVAVYELTEHGAGLRPAVYELIRWGGRFMLPPRRGDRFDDRWLPLALGACTRARDSPAHAVQLIASSKAGQVGIHISGGVDGTSLAARKAPAELTVQSEGRTLLELATGMRPAAELVASGRLHLDGDQSLVYLVPEFFDTGSAGEGLQGRQGETK
jgi:DNA-binding HxlR family transcriptional regulator